MADNYLERKMEDYRNGHTSIRHCATSTLPKNHIAIPFFPINILIAGNGDEPDATIVREFRAIRCRVAFMCPDIKKGRILAQSTGSQHIPVDINDFNKTMMAIDALKERWNKIDAIIVLSESTLRTLAPWHKDVPVIFVGSKETEIKSPCKTIIANIGNQNRNKSIASACRFLCEPNLIQSTDITIRID